MHVQRVPSQRRRRCATPGPDDGGPGRHRLVILLILASSLLFVACGGDSDDETAESEPAEAEESETAEADDSTDGGEEEADEGEDTGEAAGAAGTIRLGHLPPVATWDPHAESRAVIMSYYDTVYDTLLRYDNDFTIQPGLATEWTSDESSLTLQLRDDVIFHDGTPFDAEAVVFNLERARSTPGLSAQSLGVITAVEAVDEVTVRIDTARPAPELPFALTRMAGAIVSPTAAEADTLGTQPVGTGPYAFNAEETTEGRYVFDAFEEFYEPEQQGFVRVEHLALVDSAARLNAFQAGDIDAALVTGGERGAYEAVGAEILEFEQVASGFYFFDRGDGGVFADPLVRQAVSHAIDRETLAATAGPAEPRTTRYVEGEFGYSADATGYPYDPERAAALLAEAGAEGLSFSVPSFAQFDLANQVIQGMLAEVGIEMTIEQVPVGTLEMECASGAWAACLLPIDNLHPADLYLGSVAEAGIRNPNRVAAPAIDEAAQAALGADDAESWGAVTALITEGLPYTDLTMSTGLVGVQSGALVDPSPIRFVAGSIDLRNTSFAGG